MGIHSSQLQQQQHNVGTPRQLSLIPEVSQLGPVQVQSHGSILIGNWVKLRHCELLSLATKYALRCTMSECVTRQEHDFMRADDGEHLRPLLHYW